MKGYEPYSWPADEGWRFALITGTNRNKTCEEVTGGEDRVDGGWVKFTVAGAPALEDLLARLPAGESVFWVGSAILPEGGTQPKPNGVSDNGARWPARLFANRFRLGKSVRQV